MLGFLGDIHGDAHTLERHAQQAFLAGCAALIQVGDLGLFPHTLRAFQSIRLPLPVLFIKGNHDDHHYLRHYLTPTPMREDGNLVYVPNGTRMELDGQRIGCMGGGDSVDKAYNTHWSALESPAPEEWEELMRGPVDLLITHAPGQLAVDATTSRLGLRQFGLSPHWVSPVAVMHDYVRRALNMPPVICGHMHYAATHEGTRILNIDELHCVPIMGTFVPIMGTYPELNVEECT